MGISCPPHTSHCAAIQQPGSSLIPPLEQMGDKVLVLIPTPQFRDTPLAHSHTPNTFKALTSLQKRTFYSQQATAGVLCYLHYPPTYCLPTWSNLHTRFINIASISEARLFAYPKKKFISATSAFCRQQEKSYASAPSACWHSEGPCRAQPHSLETLGDPRPEHCSFV